MTAAAHDAEVTVRDVPDKNRFEIRVGDTLAGFSVYHPQGGTFDFTHTEIDEAFGGRGLASILIQQALEEMRARGISVLPHCPFVRRYISRHTEYLDLVPESDRARFDLPATAQAPGG